MVIFHLFFILDFFGIYESHMYNGGWLLLARFVQFSFLGLVGVSLTISSKSVKQQWGRAAIIAVAALIVTLATFIAVPDLYVRFGILHFIAVSIFLLAPIANSKYLALIITIGSFIAGFFIKKITSSSLLLIILGAQSNNFASIDHFQILPWITIPAFGIFLGNFLYKGKKRLITIPPPSNKTLSKTIGLLSKHSLALYLLHVPAILITLYLLNLLSF